MANDLSALIARLREAREWSRELDCDIYEAIDSNFPKGAVTRIEIAPGQPIFATGGYTYAHAPHYTTDLTAAVALAKRILPDWTAQTGERHDNAREDRKGANYLLQSATRYEIDDLPLA